MQADAIPVPRRAEELRWVTQHIGELMHGMILAPFALLMLAYAMWVQTHGVSLIQLWLLPAGFLLGAAGAKAVNRRYTRQFGYVRAPKPQLVQSPVLSILDPTPLPKPLQSTAQRTTSWVFLGMFVGISLLGHLREQPLFNLLFWCVFFLLPRCFSRTPRITILQLRRALSIGAMLLLLGLAAIGLSAVRFRPCASFSKWLFMYSIFGSYFVLAAYDHWLLTNLLCIRHSTEASSAG